MYEVQNSGMCELCRVAWEQRNGVKIHDMPAIDLSEWWYGDSNFNGNKDTLPSNICLENDRPDLHRKRRGLTTTDLLSDIFY